MSNIGDLYRYKYVSIFLSFGNFLKNDGGVDKVIAEQVSMLNDHGIGVIQIAPVQLGGFRLKNLPIFSVVINGRYEKLVTENEFFSLIREVNTNNIVVKGVVVHHLKKFEFSFLQRLFNSISGMIFLYLHDYYLICDQYFLLRNNESFCGEAPPSKIKCTGCEYYKPNNIRIEKTRELLQLYSDRLCYVSPSMITKRIVNNVYPRIRIEVIPHQLCIDKYFDIDISNKIKVAYIGKYVDQKGRSVWEKLAKCLKRNTDCWELMYFGNSQDPMDNIEKCYVQTSKENPQAMTKALREKKVNIALLWSLSPETYSYTYYEAYASNAFILTNSKSGNITDMVQKNKNGLVFDSENELFSFFSDVGKVKQTLEDFYASNVIGPLYLKTNDWLQKQLDCCKDSTINIDLRKDSQMRNFFVWLIDILYKWKNGL